MSTIHREGAEYAEAVEQARAQLEGIEEAASWPLSERLSAFFFMVLDAVEERAAAAEPDAPVVAFRRDASGWFSPFQEALRSTLPVIGASSDVHGVNRWLAELAPNRAAVAEVMVQLVQTSLEDDSEERQRSAALADRVLTVLASAWSTPIPAQVLDVLRYSIEAGYLPIDKWPFIRDWFGDDAKDGGDERAGDASTGDDRDVPSTEEGATNGD